MSKLEVENRTDTSSNLERSKFIGNFLNYEVLAIDLMLDNDWRKPIVDYLGNITKAT